MIAWRLCKKRHGATPIDGEGARRFGGRWNHRGTALAYCASTLSLAVLELLVHVDPADLPTDLVAIGIDIPDDVPCRTLAVKNLPKGWRDPTGCDALKDLGGAWVKHAAHAILVVPSAVLPAESNILINPNHPDAKRLRHAVPEPFSFDPRLARPKVSKPATAGKGKAKPTKETRTKSRLHD